MLSNNLSANERQNAPESPFPQLAGGYRLTSDVRAMDREHRGFRSRMRRRLLPFDGALIRCIRVVRFILILGPWRNLVVAALRRKFCDRSFPRISPTLFPNLDVDNAFRALDRDGFAAGLQLPPRLIKAITGFAARAESVKEAHWHCAEVDRVARDTAIMEVVKRYLGVEPILHSTTLFWTRPNKSGEASYPETFHYDVSDFKGVNVCFYLTDVGLESAPHVAIAGTHKRKSLLRLINPFMTDEYASERFGSRVTTFTGEKGMGFFEDLLTQHKRLACSKPRLALFVNYTIRRKSDTVQLSF